MKKSGIRFKAGFLALAAVALSIFLAHAVGALAYADGSASPSATVTESAAASPSVSPSPSPSISPSPSPSPTVTPKPTPVPTPKPRTVSCMFIGDSTTAQGVITGDILNYQSQSWLKVKLLGSRGKSPNLNEGRSGWSARNYINNYSFNSVRNSFYNTKTEKFDFPYYMKKNRYQSVKYVFINLGINDVFSYKSDKALYAEIDRVLRRYDLMVASVRKYSKSARIAVCITIPPTSSAAGFKAIYGNKQTLTRYERNNKLWVKALTAHFSGKESGKIYLVDIRSPIDRSQIVGVHPNAKGYGQIASAIWSWLQKQEK